jgi:hypothetical protein
VAGAGPTTATDPGGDTVTETVEDPITVPAADIVATSADVRPEGLVLSLRVAKPADPLVDPNWASFDSTVTWTLDVDGNGKRDFRVDYSVDDETKRLSAELKRYGSGPRPGDECARPSAYGTDAGYAVVVDLTCLGNPAAVSYQVQTSYNTNVTDDSADVAVDHSPDEGWTGPISLPGGVPGATPAPSTAQPVTPLGAATPAPAAAPGATPSTPSPPAAGARGTAPSAARPGASPTRPSTGLARANQAGPSLAHTGPARAMKLAEFAAGIILIGFGLNFATRRPAARWRAH